MKRFLTHPIFPILSEIVTKENLESYVIGGFVRDLFLERGSKDIDVVVIGSGIELAKKVAAKAGNTKVSIFKSYGTAMLKYKGYEIEFVAGYGDSADDVPDAIKLGIIMWVSDIYENRVPISEPPGIVKTILSPYIIINV